MSKITEAVSKIQIAVRAARTGASDEVRLANIEAALVVIGEALEQLHRRKASKGDL